MIIFVFVYLRLKRKKVALTFHGYNTQSCCKPLQKLKCWLKNIHHKIVAICPQLLQCKYRTKTRPIIKTKIK